MAFPQIVDADTKNGTVTTNATTWPLTYPTNLASGDLILAIVASDGAQVDGTWPSGFVPLAIGNGSACSAIWAKKVSDGTETGNFNVTGFNSEQGGWRVFRITGWGGTLGSTMSNISTSGDVVRASAVSASANPDPPALDPLQWATEDTLWIVGCSVDTSRTISVYPYAGRNTADVSGGAGGATLGLCTTESATASLDPGTFTISASDDWVAFVVAVRPSAGGAPPFSPIDPMGATGFFGL